MLGFIIGFIIGLIIIDLWFNKGAVIKFIWSKILNSFKDIQRDIKEHMESKEK